MLEDFAKTVKVNLERNIISFPLLLLTFDTFRCNNINC